MTESSVAVTRLIFRYNTERLCNDMFIVEKFSDFRQLMTDGYFPKMTTTTSARNIPPRQDNVRLHDLQRDQEQLSQKITDLERYRDRVYDCIDQGFCLDVRRAVNSSGSQC